MVQHADIDHTGLTGIPTGSVATDAIFDAKGDLPVGTDANTAAKLTVGTNGHILTAASGQATGLQWVSPNLASGVYEGTSGDMSGITGTSFVDVTGASITISTGARRCLIGVSGSSIIAAAGAGLYLDFEVDGTRLGGTNGSWDHNINANNVPFSFTRLTAALSAASHTFKLKVRVDSSSATIRQSTTRPLHFYVVEQYAA